MEENEVTKNVSQDTNKVVDERKGFSIAAMVLGIVSIVLCCVWYISIPCAILAIVFGFIGRKKAGKGMAKSGIILGFISIILEIIFISLVFLGVSFVLEEQDEIINKIEQEIIEYDNQKENINTVFEILD